MTSRKFLATTLRLSIVVGVCFGLFDGYRNLIVWDTERTEYIQHKIHMECSAMIPDEWLRQNTNKFGNIDVAAICGAGSDGKTFITNISEISAVRKGEDMFAQSLWRKPYDITKSTIAFFIGFVGTRPSGRLL